MKSDLEELHLNAREWLEYWTGQALVVESLAVATYGKERTAENLAWMKLWNIAFYELEGMTQRWAAGDPYGVPAPLFAEGTA